MMQQTIKPHRGGINRHASMDDFALSGLGQNIAGPPGAALSLCPWLLHHAPSGLILARMGAAHGY
jgi:hypothetical protein